MPASSIAERASRSSNVSAAWPPQPRQRGVSHPSLPGRGHRPMASFAASASLWWRLTRETRPSDSLRRSCPSLSRPRHRHLDLAGQGPRPTASLTPSASLWRRSTRLDSVLQSPRPSPPCHEASRQSLDRARLPEASHPALRRGLPAFIMSLAWITDPGGHCATMTRV